ncbi:hypothetical protein [Clostridium thermobutyricum]|uniref:hypothetical protein n=1 Tax=Clostridium thermobutyricum TaxID=29372 RepID=UPI0018A8C875|nr:hypothetical protein [Clostridium thermobutyricum]
MYSKRNSNYIVNILKNSQEHYSQLTQAIIDEKAVTVYRNNKTGVYFTSAQFTISNATNTLWQNKKSG